MNKTQIYTTRKLEKTIKEFISENEQYNNEYLGEWTATIFYISHKKCWLIINKLTKYLLILSDIKKSDLTNISQIFKETLYSQLILDRIVVEYELIEKIIGGIELCETNNDRSTNGSLNNCLLYLEHWKYEFGNFENMPFRDLNSRLNSSPNKMLNWKYPKEKMKEVIDAYAQHRIKFMLKFELVQTDKHSIKILLRRKNLRFLRRTNHNTKPLQNIQLLKNYNMANLKKTL